MDVFGLSESKTFSGGGNLDAKREVKFTQILQGKQVVDLGGDRFTLSVLNSNN